MLGDETATGPGSWAARWRYVHAGSAYTRIDWLNAVGRGEIKPKPPEWWLESQEREESRDRRTASIIWSRHYDPGRKRLLWDLAPDEDFRRLGYLL